MECLIAIIFFGFFVWCTVLTILLYCKANDAHKHHDLIGRIDELKHKALWYDTIYPNGIDVSIRDAVDALCEHLGIEFKYVKGKKDSFEYYVKSKTAKKKNRQ